MSTGKSLELLTNAMSAEDIERARKLSSDPNFHTLMYLVAKHNMPYEEVKKLSLAEKLAYCVACSEHSGTKLPDNIAKLLQV